MHHGPRTRLPKLPAPLSTPGDADLLARWAVDRDETAFELLVRRHASMVLGVCRRLLRDPNDVDDAFQAAFFVLARKGGSIARAEAVAAWLHRVARRAALRVRSDRGRRSDREQPGVELVMAPPDPTCERAELLRVLDEEVDKLPTRLRAAFVLCGLEGKTGDEAARLLGCPAGTVSSRLTRARDRLRSRLARRGWAPAAVAAATAPSEALFAHPVPPLIDNTLHAALLFARGGRPGAGLSRPTTIAHGVIRAMTTPRFKLAAFLLLAGMLAVGGVLAGSRADPAPPSNRAKPADDGSPSTGPVPVVRLIRPVPGPGRTARHLCTIEPAEQVDLYPAATGFLKSVNVALGDRVKKGQVLAEIDGLDLQIQYRQATIGVEQAKALLQEAEVKVEGAKTEVAAAEGVIRQRENELARARATESFRKKQLDRTKSLAESNAVDQRLLDEATEQHGAAQAQVLAATAGVDNAKLDVQVKKGKLLQTQTAITTARSNVEAAVLGAERAKLALDRMKIVAPFDGIVTSRSVTTGSLVRPDASASPLLTVVRPDTIRVVVQVPEADVLSVRQGVPARVTFDCLPGTEFTGKVARIGFVEEPRSRTMRVEIDLPNPEDKLRPGMSGAVTLKLEKESTSIFRVPADAVAFSQTPQQGGFALQPGVYVFRNGKARWIPVTIRQRSDSEAAVAGLTPEDQVIANPKALSGDNVPVKVESPGTEPSKKP